MKIVVLELGMPTLQVCLELGKQRKKFLGLGNSFCLKCLLLRKLFQSICSNFNTDAVMRNITLK